MAFNSALTFPCLASPHRVAHSKTRLSFGNVNSYNGGPKLLSWPGNRIGKTMRSVCIFAKLDGENVPDGGDISDDGNTGNNEKIAVKEADRHAELLNMTEIMMERIRKAQRMLQVESVRAQQELCYELYDGYSKGQLVKITITGLQRPVGIEVAEAAMEVGAEVGEKKLSLLVLEAHKDAFAKTTESLKKKLRNLDACMGMPEQAFEQGVL